MRRSSVNKKLKIATRRILRPRPSRERDPQEFMKVEGLSAKNYTPKTGRTDRVLMSHRKFIEFDII